MSVLPWSLSCTFIFLCWRCSSGTNLAACGLSALHRSLLRHQNPWPRIKACTTGFSLPGWYGAWPSESMETRSRFSFSRASLSPVYSVPSRRIRRFFGYRHFPEPLLSLWCCCNTHARRLHGNTSHWTDVLVPGKALRVGLGIAGHVAGVDCAGCIHRVAGCWVPAVPAEQGNGAATHLRLSSCGGGGCHLFGEGGGAPPAIGQWRRELTLSFPAGAHTASGAEYRTPRDIAS